MKQCYSCGAQIDDNVIICPVCNTKIDYLQGQHVPNTDNNHIDVANVSSQLYKRKKNSFFLVGGFVIAILAVVAFWLLSNRNNNEHDGKYMVYSVVVDDVEYLLDDYVGMNGKYELISVETDGIKVTGDDLDSVNIYLKIKGDKAILNNDGDEEEAIVKSYGDKLFFEDSTETFEGVYDPDKATIVIEIDETYFEFRNELYQKLSEINGLKELGIKVNGNKITAFYKNDERKGRIKFKNNDVTIKIGETENKGTYDELNEIISVEFSDSVIINFKKE